MHNKNHSTAILPILLTIFVILTVSIFKGREGTIFIPVSFIEAALAKSLFWCFVGFLLARYKWLIRTYLAILLFFMEVKVFMMLRFRLGITPTALSLILQTNSNEAKEFLQQYLSLGILLIMIASAAFVVALYFFAKRFFAKVHFNIPRVWRRLTVALFAILAMFSLFFNTLTCDDADENTYPWLPSKGHLCMALYTYQLPFVELIQSYNLIAHDADCIQNLTVANDRVVIDSCSFESPRIVLVIGESHIKCHSSLYGYPLETNPYLTAEKDSGRLVVFDNAMSPFAYTGDAIKYMFSTITASQPDKWEYSPLFPAVFRKAGYYVSFHDNQSTRANVSSLFDYSYSYMFNDDKCEAQCFDYRNTRLFKYDLEMVVHELPSLDSVSAPHTLDIFHLFGQHVDAFYRYPNTPENMFFRAEDYDSKRWDKKMREARAHYDNATRYNDLVLKTIIDHYRQQDAVVLYLSDHGDCVYDDEELTYGRTLNATADTPTHTSLFHGIPFIVWVSETYKSGHPEMVERLRQETHASFSHDELSNFLFLLAGIHIH